MKKMKWELGEVDWFDDKSGEGFIKGGDGKLYYVHHSCIDTKEKCRTLKGDSKVRFVLYDEPQAKRILKVMEI